MKEPLQIVWLKRDLRAHDHTPLAAAVRAGATIALYVYEPSIVRARDFDAQHLDFINGALAELEARLGNRGVPLCYRHGELPEVLERLHQEIGIAGLWAHEETGNALSYARDRRVRAWVKQRGIPFREFPHSGVVRRLQSRDGWAEQWEAKMRATVSPPPRQAATIGEIPRGRRHDARELGVRSHALRTHITLAGERAAHDLLQSFLSDRGRDYRREMSSPISAPTACSRLSPHFTWGTMSVRQAYQAAMRAHEALTAPHEKSHRQSIASFVSRLA